MIEDYDEEPPAEDNHRLNRQIEEFRLAYEQMLMSWIRASVSLLSFGYAIYKFFGEQEVVGSPPGIFTPRLIGMFMISTGLLGLLCAFLEHRVAYTQLRSVYPALQRSLTSLLCKFILCIGLLFFMAALLRQ